MKIRVRFWDVLFGQRTEPMACMVARAISRAMPDAIAVSVGGRQADIWGADWLATYRLPEDVQSKICLFDSFGFVRPFAFELRPGDLLRLTMKHSLSRPIEQAQELVTAA